MIAVYTWTLGPLAYARMLGVGFEGQDRGFVVCSVCEVCGHELESWEEPVGSRICREKSEVLGQEYNQYPLED